MLSRELQHLMPTRISSGENSGEAPCRPIAILLVKMLPQSCWMRSIWLRPMLIKACWSIPPKHLPHRDLQMVKGFRGVEKSRYSNSCSTNSCSMLSCLNVVWSYSSWTWTPSICQELGMELYVVHSSTNILSDFTIHRKSLTKRSWVEDTILCVFDVIHSVFLPYWAILVHFLIYGRNRQRHL